MNKKAVRKSLLDSGVQKPVGPHTFRHYVTTQLFQAGTVLREIQELLGHKDL